MSCQSDQIRVLNQLLRENKETMDINNLLLMYQQGLITESDLNNNKLYQKYIDEKVDRQNKY